jgi:hypothetical protein
MAVEFTFRIRRPLLSTALTCHEKALKKMEVTHYYQCSPESHAATSFEQFPKNHVNFSPLLKPVEWIDRVYGLFDQRAFQMMGVLKEFDRAAPLDEKIGTQQELLQNRHLVALFCRVLPLYTIP